MYGVVMTVWAFNMQGDILTGGLSILAHRLYINILDLLSFWLG